MKQQFGDFVLSVLTLEFHHNSIALNELY